MLQQCLGLGQAHVLRHRVVAVRLDHRGAGNLGHVARIQRGELLRNPDRAVQFTHALDEPRRERGPGLRLRAGADGDGQLREPLLGERRILDLLEHVRKGDCVGEPLRHTVQAASDRGSRNTQNLAPISDRKARRACAVTRLLLSSVGIFSLFRP